MDNHGECLFAIADQEAVRGRAVERDHVGEGGSRTTLTRGRTTSRLWACDMPAVAVGSADSCDGAGNPINNIVSAKLRAAEAQGADGLPGIRGVRIRPAIARCFMARDGEEN